MMFFIKTTETGHIKLSHCHISISRGQRFGESYVLLGSNLHEDAIKSQFPSDRKQGVAREGKSYSSHRRTPTTEKLTTGLNTVKAF